MEGVNSTLGHIKSAVSQFFGLYCVHNLCVALQRSTFVLSVSQSVNQSFIKFVHKTGAYETHTS